MKLTRSERIIAVGFGLTAGLFYLGIALLPVIAMTTTLFQVKTEAEVKRIESVLSQFGTIGDMFGALNTFFTGCAFAGLVYTILLQRRELRLQNDELNRQATERTANRMSEASDDLIEAYNLMTQNYAIRYNADKERHDDDYNMSLNRDLREKHGILTPDELFCPPASETLKGKLFFCTEQIEKHLETRKYEYKSLVRAWLRKLNAEADCPDPDFESLLSRTK